MPTGMDMKLQAPQCAAILLESVGRYESVLMKLHIGARFLIRLSLRWSYDNVLILHLSSHVLLWDQGMASAKPLLYKKSVVCCHLPHKAGREGKEGEQSFDIGRSSVSVVTSS